MRRSDFVPLHFENHHAHHLLWRSMRALACATAHFSRFPAHLGAKPRECAFDRFSLTRESMTMQRLALMQEVPNRAKRDAQIAGAEAKVERERAALGVQRLQIRQELSQAWIMAQAIEQRAQVLAGLLSENQRLQDSLLARIAGGTA